MKTVANQLAETLAAAGVKRIYGIVCDNLNSPTDAIRREAKIKRVHVRQEEVAAFAAGEDAHLTGEFAVCAESSAPRNLHRIELEQKSTGLLHFGTEPNYPSFAAVAQAIGIREIRLTNPVNVDDGNADALTHDGPVLIDAGVSRTELAMPFSNLEMAKGFSFNGRADEIVNLTKTDLWR